jgi:CBS domain-containing protein
MRECLIRGVKPTDTGPRLLIYVPQLKRQSAIVLKSSKYLFLFFSGTILTSSVTNPGSMGKVRDILKLKGNSIFSVKPSITVYEALELMVQKNIGALLVAENEKFLGIFSERDYARKVILKGKTSRETMIKEVMTENPVTATPDTTIDECMKMMSVKFIRYIPVLSNGELVGIISIGDLVKFIIDEQRYIIEDLEHYITGHQSGSL